MDFLLATVDFLLATVDVLLATVDVLLATVDFLLVVHSRDVNRAAYAAARVPRNISTNLTAQCGPRAVRIVVYYFVLSICVFNSCLVTDSLVRDFSGVNERSNQE